MPELLAGALIHAFQFRPFYLYTGTGCPCFEAQIQREKRITGMTYFLLLGGNGNHQMELQSLLLNAGYRVEHMSEPGHFCRQLQQMGQAACNAGIFPHAMAPAKGVVLLPAMPEPEAPVGASSLPQLQSAILDLARQMTHGWRLNMRQRTLLAPNGLQLNLTALEYNFIRIFSMAEVAQAVSRKVIVKEFGEDYLNYDQNRIDAMVRRLRKKVLERTGMKLPLSTIRVRGFAFNDVLSLDIA